MIYILGEGLIDMIEKPQKGGNLYFPCVGGSPLNTATVLAKQGIEAAMAGEFSTDFFGNLILSHLEKSGVSTEYLKRSEKPTTLAFVTRDTANKPQYAFFTQNSADLHPSAGSFPTELHPDSSAVIFGSIALGFPSFRKEALPFLKMSGESLFLSFDPNIRPALMGERADYLAMLSELLPLVSMVKLSDEDLAWIYADLPPEEGIAEFFKAGVALVVYTLGREGAKLINSNGAVTLSSYDTPLVDSVGAGDTFHGSLIAYLSRRNLLDKRKVAHLSKKELKELGQWATVAAGINCSREGCHPPTSDEIEKAIAGTNISF